MLKEAGVHPDQCGFSSTPLHTASYWGCLESVKLLIAAGAQVNMVDYSGKTSLFLAVEKLIAWFDIIYGNMRHRHIMDELLKAGADPDISDEENGFTPLYMAIYSFSDDVVKLLIKSGANPNKPNKSGETPLMLAKRSGFKEMAKLLKKYGAK